MPHSVKFIYFFKLSFHILPDVFDHLWILSYRIYNMRWLTVKRRIDGDHFI